MPVIPQKELRNNVGEVLRRAEAGEEFTITVAGRPVAHLGPARRRQWVSGAELTKIWDTPAPETLAEDLEHFPDELADPFTQVRALLDTSVLIGTDDPGALEGAISAATLAELHFGLLIAGAQDERGRRALRLGVIESTFEPLPIDAAVAREWGRLAAAVQARGGQPRRRALDLAIAATASVHNVPLLTRNATDLQLVNDLIDVRTPQTTALLDTSAPIDTDDRTAPTGATSAARLVELQLDAPVTTDNDERAGRALDLIALPHDALVASPDRATRRVGP